MKTEFDEDNSAWLAIIIATGVVILTSWFYFWPAAGAIGDMVRDKELNPIVGFVGFILMGGISPIGAFFASIYVFAVGSTKLEECVFAKNRKFKQAAEFIIEARGNK